jgi:hypothetical protein
MDAGLDDSTWTSIQQRQREAALALRAGEAAADTADSTAAADTAGSPSAADTTGSPAAAETAASPASPAAAETAASPAAADTADSPAAADTADSPAAASSPEPTLDQCPPLAPMDDGVHCNDDCLPLTLAQYIELLEWTGRQARDDKPGKITAPPPELLRACGLDPDEWLDSLARYGALGGFVGHPEKLRERAERLGQRRVKGQNGGGVSYAVIELAA